jgi:hypothetical protein
VAYTFGARGVAQMTRASVSKGSGPTVNGAVGWASQGRVPKLVLLSRVCWDPKIVSGNGQRCDVVRPDAPHQRCWTPNRVSRETAPR